MSRANFENYLAGTSGHGFEDGAIVVTVANPLIRDALEQRFRPHILRSLLEVAHKPCGLRLVTPSPLTGG